MTLPLETICQSQLIATTQPKNNQTLLADLYVLSQLLDASREASALVSKFLDDLSMDGFAQYKKIHDTNPTKPASYKIKEMLNGPLTFKDKQFCLATLTTLAQIKKNKTSPLLESLSLNGAFKTYLIIHNTKINTNTKAKVKLTIKKLMAKKHFPGRLSAKYIIANPTKARQIITGLLCQKPKPRATTKSGIFSFERWNKQCGIDPFSKEDTCHENEKRLTVSIGSQGSITDPDNSPHHAPKVMRAHAATPLFTIKARADNMFQWGWFGLKPEGSLNINLLDSGASNYSANGYARLGLYYLFAPYVALGLFGGYQHKAAARDVTNEIFWSGSQCLGQGGLEFRIGQQNSTFNLNLQLSAEGGKIIYETGQETSIYRGSGKFRLSVNPPRSTSIPTLALQANMAITSPRDLPRQVQSFETEDVNLHLETELYLRLNNLSWQPEFSIKYERQDSYFDSELLEYRHNAVTNNVNLMIGAKTPIGRFRLWATPGMLDVDPIRSISRFKAKLVWDNFVPFMSITGQYQYLEDNQPEYTDRIHKVTAGPEFSLDRFVEFIAQ